MVAGVIGRSFQRRLPKGSREKTKVFIAKTFAFSAAAG